MSSEPAGIYLHVPFCSAICPYCDFAVTVAKREARSRFVSSLREEIDRTADTLGSRFGAFDTIYFGGGTPSLLEPEELEAILARLRDRFEIHADAVLHFEANPEDVTPERALAWKHADVRFLSLGIQSVDDDELRFLGRRHRRDDALASLDAVRGAKIDTVSIDLIYGLPGQSERAWRTRLRDAIALEPDHLSCYQLTVHDETHFGRRRREGRWVELPDDDQGQRFESTHRLLAESGIPGYEVSNFARSPRHRSRHNRKYWYHVPYLGLGPSAHSFDGTHRWWNVRSPARWERRIADGTSPIEETERLDRSALALEAVMLGLRTVEGIDLAALSHRLGIDLVAANRALFERLPAEGLATVDGGVIRPTLRGLAVADSLARRVAIPA